MLYLSSLCFAFLSILHLSFSMSSTQTRRADGIIMGYDPYAPEMVNKYGRPGQTDNEGFNPYADSVGPGIYGGIVKRDQNGEIIIGEQYQNHNPNPGPVYAGGGYTPIVNALKLGDEALKILLDQYPDLVNDISTGGATPLHMCGMSRDGQASTAYLIQRGADIEAVDTYAYKPLHRMASNNLAIGAEALLLAGADVYAVTSRRGETAMTIARSAGAADVIAVLLRFMKKK
jgi:ankyrin repeat protein